MAFVNEYASEEDISKYGLDEVMLHHHPKYKKSGYPFKYNWTIDRDEEIYLICVDVGREEHCNRYTWILNIRGKNIEIVTDREGGSKKYDEIPFIVMWSLVNVKPRRLENPTLNYEEIKRVFKDALTVYSDDGANSFIQNATVKFNF